jgi:predicted phage terminase large subunit-like protein
MTPAVDIIPATLEEIEREIATRRLLEFMRHIWWYPQPFEEGYHTTRICERITKAVDDYLEGKSTCLIIEVPYRHGKSDIVSRALPPFFLGRCADSQPDIIMTGYGANLVEGFSRKAKKIIQSTEYQELFPSVKLSRDSNSVSTWSIEGSAGEVTAAGLTGGITGKGGALIIIDDYCKRREEAESQTYRDKVWDAFKDDVMTRRPPVSITIICATRWNIDDLSGRIKKSMDEDPDFPQFETMSFPAHSEEYVTEDNPHGDLFPERYDHKYYVGERARLGKYSAAALLDCDPSIKGGNRFPIDRVQIHHDVKEFPDTRYVRFWDLASTVKERDKDDPDATSGSLCGITMVDDQIHFWLKDEKSCTEEAPKRDKLILSTARADGPTVKIGVESVGGYKDSWATLKAILKGIRTVIKVLVSSDKSVRAAPLEPIMEAGCFHVLDGPWLAAWFAEVGAFPSKGVHDDKVDSMSGAYGMLAKPEPSFFKRSSIGM